MKSILMIATITAFLAKEFDKNYKIFGNDDIVKSKVAMELKTASTLKKKDKMVRKMKAKFGEGAGDDDEEEEEVQGQEPLALTQGMGEDQEEEGAEEEEAKEAPTKLEPKKMKAKEQPTSKHKENKTTHITQ